MLKSLCEDAVSMNVAMLNLQSAVGVFLRRSSFYVFSQVSMLSDVPQWQQSCILDRNKQLKIGREPYNITYPKICQAVCEKTNFKISASQNAFAALAAMLNFLSARNILKIIRLLSLLHYLVKLCGTEFQRRSCLYGFPPFPPWLPSWNLEHHKNL